MSLLVVISGVDFKWRDSAFRVQFKCFDCSSKGPFNRGTVPLFNLFLQLIEKGNKSYFFLAEQNFLLVLTRCVSTNVSGFM